MTCKIAQIRCHRQKYQNPTGDVNSSNISVSATLVHRTGVDQLWKDEVSCVPGLGYCWSSAAWLLGPWACSNTRSTRWQTWTAFFPPWTRCSKRPSTSDLKCAGHCSQHPDCQAFTFVGHKKGFLLRLLLCGVPSQQQHYSHRGKDLQHDYHLYCW